MDFDALLARLVGLRGLAEVTEYGAVAEAGREFPLLAVRVAGPREVVVTAGFHGDEIAGPLTLAEHGEAIVAWARAAGVGLRLYPCVNPSGFAVRQRYNASGERPNNDFLRYEVGPGVWQEDLDDGQAFLRHVPAEGTPKETAALAAELARHAPPAAALDIHQDNFIEGAWFYAYIFGARAPYLPLVHQVQAHVPVLRGAVVDSGYAPDTDLVSDGDGLIVYHDGSVTDLFHRAGVPVTAAIETTGATPLDRCHRANLVWIRGFIDLAARGG